PDGTSTSAAEHGLRDHCNRTGWRGTDAVAERKVMEPPDRIELARADVEHEVLRQVAPSHVERPADGCCFPRDDLVDVSQSFGLCPGQGLRKVAEFDPVPRHPGGEKERQAREALPRLSEIELVGHE